MNSVEEFLNQPAEMKHIAVIGWFIFMIIVGLMCEKR